MQSPRITRLLADPSPRAVDAFWREVTTTGTPMVEPWDDDCVLVTFLWRGAATSTRAWWGVDVPLSRVPGTDLWLTRTENGWRMRADVRSRDAYDTLLANQDDLIQRFADSALGELSIEPVFHG